MERVPEPDKTLTRVAIQVFYFARTRRTQHSPYRVRKRYSVVDEAA